MSCSSVNRKFIFFAGLLLVITLFHRCAEEDSPPPTGQGWSSSDFSSIPIRQRIMQADRGNLVRNPSFEFGRSIDVDSAVHSSNITAWTMMGENVTWVFDSTSEPTADEVRSGSHSIQIHRDHAEPYDRKGAGIISDFIRVIPGNYDLSFWIRLSDIKPPRVRKGRRMSVGIDIRILFYDKNRLLLSENPNLGQESAGYIRKSDAFSDFWYIDSLGWTSVKGRSSNNFFTKGDIPDEARYVKVYLGLRGSGTMWIDDVDLRYGRRNFTPLERTSRLVDTSLAKLELILPTPKEIKSAEPYQFHFEGSDTLPLPIILIPLKSEKQTRAAADLLKSKIDGVFAKHFGTDSIQGIQIIAGGDPGEIGEGGLIFSLGDRSLARGMENLQGYVIRTDTLNSNLIHLSGASARGDFYAAATAIQMLDGFLFYRADIRDFPDIHERAFMVSPVTAASNTIDYIPHLTEMAGMKLNFAYLDYYRSKTLWQQESTAYLDGLKAIGKENRTTEMLSLAQMVNPYAFLPEGAMVDSLDTDLRERWTHSGDASMERLKVQLHEGLKAGATTLVLCTNDHLPLSPEGNYNLYSQKDNENYLNLQAAHLEMIRSVLSWRNGIDRGIGIEFLSPWYSNNELGLSRGQAERYLVDLASKLPEDLKFLWTGPSIRSADISKVDFKRYQELSGRELVLMDNTLGSLSDLSFDTLSMNGNHMKLRSLSLFDPFAVDFSDPFALLEGNGKMLVNAPLSSEIMKLRMATAADFMWNTGDYNPDISIYKVLVSGFGEIITTELYVFNDAYYSALASIIGLRNGMEQQRTIRHINVQFDLMEETLHNLDRSLVDRPELLNELKQLKQSVESIYDAELKTVANQIIASLKSM